MVARKTQRNMEHLVCCSGGQQIANGLPQDEAPKMPEPKIERKYFVIFSRSLS
jgi:hypothetical protein